MKITDITAATGFTYSDAPQKSPEWIAIRAPRVGASQLGDWMAVGVKGQPLKARADLEGEIAFAKAFNQPMSRYVNGAMQEGIDNEDFMAEQYATKFGVTVDTCGCFYNEHFVASPDRLVGTDGLLEIKWLQDNKFNEVVKTGEPLREHTLQMQGQMWSTGRQWCDYMVGNGNTGRYIVIRVKRDEEITASIAESVPAVADIAALNTKDVFAFTTQVPEQITEWK